MKLSWYRVFVYIYTQGSGEEERGGREGRGMVER